MATDETNTNIKILKHAIITKKNLPFKQWQQNSQNIIKISLNTKIETKIRNLERATHVSQKVEKWMCLNGKRMAKHCLIYFSYFNLK